MTRLPTAAITGSHLAAVLAGAAIIWIVLAAVVALYGSPRFKFAPLFISAVFIGWPLVLLAVTIGNGLADQRAETIPSDPPA